MLNKFICVEYDEISIVLYRERFENQLASFHLEDIGVLHKILDDIKSFDDSKTYEYEDKNGVKLSFKPESISITQKGEMYSLSGESIIETFRKDMAEDIECIEYERDLVAGKIECDYEERPQNCKGKTIEELGLKFFRPSHVTGDSLHPHSSNKDKSYYDSLWDSMKWEDLYSGRSSPSFI